MTGALQAQGPVPDRETMVLRLLIPVTARRLLSARGSGPTERLL